MLSRSAQGLYWIGRYLERAAFLCRLLRLQSEALVDRPLRDIHFGWTRIYGGLNRTPPGGSLQPTDSDDFTLADSYTLADDLTFERSNPDSVWSCFYMGRENARQMRHCISGELWTSLNLGYLRIQKLSIQDIWVTSPEGFYADTAAEMDRFAGVAAATMYRDEGWRFMQLGRFIEWSQMSAALFLAQLDYHTDPSDEYFEADWSSLLRVYHAVEAYNHSYSVEVVPERVLDLLATDPLLPNSLCRSLDRTVSNLESIAAGPNPRASGAARRLAGRMAALVHYDWPDTDDRRELLHRVRDEGRDLHRLVTQAYFDYSIADTSGL